MMPKNKAQTERQNRARIKIKEDQEVGAWAQKFGVTKLELKRAVGKAGDASEAVRNELSRTTPLPMQPHSRPMSASKKARH